MFFEAEDAYVCDVWSIALVDMKLLSVRVVRDVCQSAVLGRDRVQLSLIHQHF